MTAPVLVVVLFVGLVGLLCVGVLIAAFLEGLAIDAKEVVEARCERLDHEWSDDELLAYRAEVLAVEAEQWLAGVGR